MQPRLFCECIWVKPVCKSIIMRKKALLRFNTFSFSDLTHFQWECYGHYASIKIAIFKTVRMLDTIWNFARGITRVSTHRSTEQHTLYTKMCRSSSTSGLPWWWQVEQATANVSCSKTFVLVNCVYTNNVLKARVHVYPWWYYEQSFMMCRAFLVF